MTERITRTIASLFDHCLQALSRACADIFDSPASTGAEPAPVWVSEQERRAPAPCRIKLF